MCVYDRNVCKFLTVWLKVCLFSEENSEWARQDLRVARKCYPMYQWGGSILHFTVKVGKVLILVVIVDFCTFTIVSFSHKYPQYSCYVPNFCIQRLLTTTSIKFMIIYRHKRLNGEEKITVTSHTLHIRIII